MRILLAEDDNALAQFISKGLEAEHYMVDTSSNGEQATRLAKEFEYDLLVLDLGLPQLDGISVLHRVRECRPNLPILVLTARIKVEERVRCLDMGADDYLTKPFSFSELSARIRAVLRRTRTVANPVLEVADLKLDRLQHKVERGGKCIALTTKEFALLEYLMRNAGRRITRAMIIEHVWNIHLDTATNVVDVYVAFLGAVFQAALVSAEHLTYREFLQPVAENTYVASCRLEPAGVNALMQLDLSVAFSLVDLLLGGEGKEPVLERGITEIEEQILESVLRIICRELQRAWQALSLEFHFDQRQQTTQARRLLPGEEKVLSLCFEITLPGARGNFNLAVPAVVSNALLRKISDYTYQKPREHTDSAERIRQRLLECPFTLELRVADIMVPAEQLLELTQGDLLMLPRSIDDAAVLIVGSRGAFSSAVAKVGKTRAAQLLERLPQKDCRERKDHAG
jgi:flagellar motor switch protein FliM